MPPGNANTVEAWPVGFSATWANCRLPSFMVTAPVAGCPSSAATLTATEAFVCPPWSLVVTVSEVRVDTAFDALCAPATAIGSTSSAKPSPATKSSRRLRRFMPLTCTCSKSPEESRIAKSRIALCLSVEDYCIWPGRGGANRPTAICPEKNHASRADRALSPAYIGRGASGIESPPGRDALCFFFEVHRHDSGQPSPPACPPDRNPGRTPRKGHSLHTSHPR